MKKDTTSSPSPASRASPGQPAKRQISQSSTSWRWIFISIGFGIVTVGVSVFFSGQEGGALSKLVSPLKSLISSLVTVDQKLPVSPPVAPVSPSIAPGSSPVAPAAPVTPKITEYPKKLVAFASGHCIKKDTSSSAHECGEDAFSIYISPEAPKSGRTFFGVADGVGGWGLSGGDSSKVSTGILEEMRTLASTTKLSLSEVASLAFSRMAAQKVHKQGSTTLCTGILDHESGRFDISNIGDSGAFVIREGKAIFKTKVGVEGFNAPHQVGFDHDGNPYGSIQLFETRHSIFLRPGDIVVMVTDGVLDNLYEQEIIGMISAMVGPIADRSVTNKVTNMRLLDAALKERLKSASTTLAWHSWARSNEVNWKSPFAQTAQSHGYMFSGG